MKKAYSIIALNIFLFSLFLAPLYSQAATIRTDKTAFVGQEEKISDNMYLVGAEPKVLGEVNSDVFATGNNIEIGGNLNGDLLAIGTNILVKGKINGDVRVAGGNVVVENEISGDLVVAAAEVTINESAKIKGDVILIGGDVIIKNNSEKHIRVISGSTTIFGKILNSANITSQKINILKDSEVSGDLSYFSPRQAFIEEGAKVTGSVTFNKVDSIRENGLVKHTVVSFLNFWMVFRFVTTLILTFILVYIFKIFSQRTTNQSINEFGKSFLVGLITLIFLPLIIVISLISLILIPVGLLLLMIYIGVFIISTAVAGIALGSLMKKTFGKNKNLEVSFQTASLGVVILTLLQFVPFLGDTTRLIFILAAFGSVWIYLYDKVRWGNLK